MVRLTRALNAWGTAEFDEILKKQVEQMGVEQLPLQQGLSVGNYALDGKINVLVISVSDDTNFIYVKAGIFYTGIIAGCSCADDPTPLDESCEYCEVQIVINKSTAQTEVALLAG